MASHRTNLVDVLEHATDLMAKNECDRAWAELHEARYEHFFNESFHDLFGECCWARAERDQPDSRYDLLHRRTGERVSAGLHWFLSSRDDERARKWRSIVIEECAGHPARLFRALH